MGDPYVDTLRPGVTLKHDPHFQRLWESVQRAIRHGATVQESNARGGRLWESVQRAVRHGPLGQFRHDVFVH